MEKGRMAMRRACCPMSVVLALCLALAAIDGAAAQSSAEKFYGGRRIEFLVGSAPGGGYGFYAGVLARHMGPHIPGKPTITVRNLDGASSLIAANELATRSARDGSVFAALFTGAILEPLIGDPAHARYDARKFHYVGSANREASICFAWHTSAVQSFSDVLAREMIVSAPGVASSARQYPVLLNNIVGTRFKVIAGYSGSQETAQAVEKGEAEGSCLPWSSFAPLFGNWVTEKKIRLFGQIALPGGDPLLNRMGVPEIWSLVKRDEDRETLQLIIAQTEFGRPYMTPPDVPADRVAALRAGFDATMNDPDFLAEAERTHLPISPMSGAEVQQAVERIYATPPALVARARDAIK
jgi:tripartite-type tricarboxylate transporter receptor subunit TctC